MEGYIIFLGILLLFLSPLILGLIFMGGQKKTKIKHQESGVEKNAYTGYAWAYFFFGFFVPIFRGEILIGVLHFVFSMVTFGIFQIIMPFLYNKQHTVRLLTDGWKLSDTEENNTHAKTKIGIA
jgi:hypothetical protein